MPSRRPSRQRRRTHDAQMATAATAEAVAALDVEQAMAEILGTPAAAIHRTAAFTWGARAVASYRVCVRKAAFQDCLSYFYLGEHYREAALAHAAMGEDWQPLYAEIDRAMEADRREAARLVRTLSADGNRPTS